MYITFVSCQGALSPHGSITERKRRRLDMDGIKSPGARTGRKISEYFKVNSHFNPILVSFDYV